MSHSRSAPGRHGPDPPAPDQTAAEEAVPDAAGAETTAAGGFRDARLSLAHARRDAAQTRLRSELLCARAVGVSHTATAARDLAVTHRELWQGWHKAWAELAPAGAARLLRVCVYCGAAVLERADPSEPGAWGPVPPWVHDRLRAGALGVRPTHGACPSCAEAWLARV